MRTPNVHASLENNLPEGGRILAGDIGGTKCNLALFKVENGELQVITEQSFRSQDFNTFEALIEVFYQNLSGTADTVSLGIAGPVYKGKVKATNLPWIVDADKIGERLSIENVFLLNDLEANAYGIAMLQPEDFKMISPGDTAPEGNAAVISPGTGLGEAGMYWDGSSFHPFATEGGHTSFAPRDDRDIALFLYLQKKFGHVSWERVLSGPGIYNIYLFLVEEMMGRPPEKLREEIRMASEPSLMISKAAAEGSCDVCREVMELFFKYLGEEAAHLGLKIKATGGMFIGGGIVPDVLNQRSQEIFQEAFLKIGRMKALLTKMPVKVIMNERTPLLGAAYYGWISGNVHR